MRGEPGEMEFLENDNVSDDDVPQEAHNKLLNAVSQLYKKQRIGAPKRREPVQEISEFSLSSNTEDRKNRVHINDLLKDLQEKVTHKEINAKVKAAQKKSRTLPTPLEKIQADKISREIGYQNVCKKLDKWKTIVERNKLADQLIFPLHQKPVEMEPTSNQKKIKEPSELEKAMAAVLNQSEIAQEEKKMEESLSKLSIEEMIERRKMIAKMRARESYRIAKAVRQNKIKSKKYHRILKKERIKQELKDFETLQKTDPEAALAKLEQIERARAEERISLRHRNTGKWARSRAIRAKYDTEARMQLAEQLAKSRELTRKVKVDESSDSEGEMIEEDHEGDDPEPSAQAPQAGPANPWVKESVVDEFLSGYKKFHSEKLKVDQNEKESVWPESNQVKSNENDQISTNENDNEISELHPGSNSDNNVIKNNLENSLSNVEPTDVNQSHKTDGVSLNGEILSTDSHGSVTNSLDLKSKSHPDEMTLEINSPNGSFKNKESDDKQFNAEAHDKNEITSEISRSNPITNAETDDRQSNVKTHDKKEITSEISGSNPITNAETDDRHSNVKTHDKNEITSEISGSNPITNAETDDRHSNVKTHDKNEITSEISGSNPITNAETDDRQSNVKTHDKNEMPSEISTPIHYITTPETDDKQVNNKTHEKGETEISVGDIQSGTDILDSTSSKNELDLSTTSSTLVPLHSRSGVKRKLSSDSGIKDSQNRTPPKTRRSPYIKSVQLTSPNEAGKSSEISCRSDVKVPLNSASPKNSGVSPGHSKKFNKKRSNLVSTKLNASDDKLPLDGNSIELVDSSSDTSSSEMSVQDTEKSKETLVSKSGSWCVISESSSTEKKKLKKKSRRKTKVKTLNEMFDDAEEAIQNRSSAIAEKLKKETELINEIEKDRVFEEKEENSLMKPFRGTRKNHGLDEALIEINEEGISSGVNDLKSIKDKLNCPVNVENKEPQIDPNKHINVKPQKLFSEIGDLEEAANESDEENTQKMDLMEAFADDDIADEFRKEKDEESKKNKAEEISLIMPGWGSWGGTSIPTKTKRKRRRFSVKLPKVPRKDEKKEHVIINEDPVPKLKKQLVNELPYPFTSVKDFEASIRAPIGKTWVPEKAHKRLVAPPVITKMGKIIEPMSDNVDFSKKKRRRQRLK